jgi:hypothetical protein
VAELVQIGTGRNADVFALGDDRVLRRYRDGGDVSAEAAVCRTAASETSWLSHSIRVRGCRTVTGRRAGVVWSSEAPGEVSAPEA